MLRTSRYTYQVFYDYNVLGGERKKMNPYRTYPLSLSTSWHAQRRSRMLPYYAWFYNLLRLLLSICTIDGPPRTILPITCSYCCNYYYYCCTTRLLLKYKLKMRHWKLYIRDPEENTDFYADILKSLDDSTLLTSNYAELCNRRFFFFSRLGTKYENKP